MDEPQQQADELLTKFGNKETAQLVTEEIIKALSFCKSGSLKLVDYWLAVRKLLD